ncbi:hypothetical protein RICGR_0584 [Rickettsiella grylli]|uniref:Uncharacterized protein n=1 Tax=Rickettsiella grylli TaxID=59196 RepID=A8PLZ8_9COXI|nr:hypothetical protein RICGR_0584 [Rickettsiella grylli]
MDFATVERFLRRFVVAGFLFTGIKSSPFENLTVCRNWHTHITTHLYQNYFDMAIISKNRPCHFFLYE